MRKRRENHGLSKTRLYRIWVEMIRRCHDKSRHDYQRYGGVGVAVCGEWRDSFIAFYNWSNGNGYAAGMTIDRKRSSGGYCPENCRWLTLEQQAWNRRKPNQNRGQRHSPFIGVSYDATGGKWRSKVTTSGRVIELGRFGTAVEAALAYDSAAFSARGNVSHLNFPERFKGLLPKH